MSPPPPTRPKIYHITHIDNLAGIAAEGVLVSDATMIARGGPAATIGMSDIKERRLTLPVKCHPGLAVGDCVPFYFCPRSVMLFVIHCDNNPALTYHGGQGPIVHLEADLHEVMDWADREQRRWAFSLSNAGAYYTAFRGSRTQLGEVGWAAVAATDFRSATVKEEKQAEFLMAQSFPWDLVTRIGVSTPGIATKAAAAVATATHRPRVEVVPTWYF